MEYNASESKFAVEITIDFIKSFVRPSSKTPIQTTVKLETEAGGEIEVPPVPFGLIAKELKDNEYFVRINARTGAIPSNVLQQAQIVRTLQATPPGSPAFFKLLQQFASINDRDLSLEDFGFQAQQAAGPAQGVPGGVDESLEAPAAAETERQLVNKGRLQEQPAI